MGNARLLWIVGAVLLSGTAASARQGHDHATPAPAVVAAGAKDCAALPAPALPPELAGWSGARSRVEAASSAAGLASAMLSPGQAVEAILLPTPQVVFAASPEKPGDAASQSGMFRIDIAQAGRYRVTLGAGAWVDIAEDGAALPSVAHGHGPDCSGIRKMVDFDLKAGAHILQISGARDAALAMMVARLP